MRIRDSLVHLDTEEQGNRLRLAAGLVRRHGAHLTGLHVYDVLLPLLVGDSSSGSSGAVLLVEMLERMRQDAIAVSGGVEAAFREPRTSRGTNSG
ncbi:hypothetical protein [Falsiroseomonas oryziterrae]|uniref:hypothetical protein n=1 Tax=Falsiroseomonas oryziterrae TaxID=2911368 RepID=UPI001F175EC3|nr:hypothetical protein [Roseomonas sp. NPKOSM-4]